MNNKVLDTIDKYNMINNDDSVCVALSGGADSVSLFYFLILNKDLLNIKTIYACHLNHMLRGEESERDENFVRNLCYSHKVQLFVKKVDINKMSEDVGKSIEETARDARYDFFWEIHNKYHTKIATAHTLSDCMETTVFNLARGSGLKGLCGITPIREYIIRPLIRCSRQEIEKYCCDKEIEFVTDSTNLTDDYSRNKIRHLIIPKFYELNNAVESSFARFYAQGEAEEDFMNSEAIKALKEIQLENSFDRNKYLKFHKAIKNRVISIILTNNNIPTYAQRLELIDNYINSGTGGIQLNDDLFLRVNDAFFEVSGEKEKTPYFEYEYETKDIEKIDKISLPLNKKLQLKLIQCEQNKNFENISNKDLKKMLDYDKIDGKISIRQKKDGDKITLNKRDCTKSLKKLFNEMKIPSFERNNKIIISDEKEIIWVEGAGCSKKVNIDQNTKNILAIHLEDNYG